MWSAETARTLLKSRDKFSILCGRFEARKRRKKVFPCAFTRRKKKDPGKIFHEAKKKGWI
jgi:hypothetical protein